jgi:hypothetical protein
VQTAATSYSEFSPAEVLKTVSECRRRGGYSLRLARPKQMTFLVVDDAERFDQIELGGLVI